MAAGECDEYPLYSATSWRLPRVAAATSADAPGKFRAAGSKRDRCAGAKADGKAADYERWLRQFDKSTAQIRTP